MRIMWGIGRKSWHRFPRPISLKPGDIVPVLFRHDRSQIAIRLLM